MVLESIEYRAESIEHRAKSEERRRPVHSALGAALCALNILLLFLSGCATGKKEMTFALVNGEDVTESALVYSLNISHRRERLSATEDINIKQFLNKLIDDRLIMQEARRMGLEQFPEIQQSIKAYILRESVIRLHEEEIIQKVVVSDKETADRYKNDFESFTLGVIEVNSEDDAKKILEQLKEGGDFKGLVEKYSSHASRRDGGEITVIRRSLTPQIQEVVSTLKEGELSDIVKAGDRYVVIKLIKRQEAPDEELEKVRNNIIKEIRKVKERERSDEYLKSLREKASIKIDRELLASIKLDAGGEEAEKWLNDDRRLVETYDSVLTAGDFVKAALATRHKMPSDTEKPKEDIIDGWVNVKLVDHEALNRHYENRQDLKESLEDYKDQLLKNAFIKKAIIPKIEVSDKDLEEYYSTHQKEFLKPVRVRLQQITLKTEEEANEVLKNLKEGADFSWAAKRKSIDSARENGGDTGWLALSEIPESLRGEISKLKKGEMSPVLKFNMLYGIVKLIGKTEDEVEDFAKVKDAVFRSCFNVRFKELFDNYVSQLKKDAEIIIYEDEVKAFEEKFKK